ncbi:MAG: EpsG family protein [Allosphingosinicella sp.]
MFPYWLLYSVFAVGAISHRFDPQARPRISPLFVLAAFFVMVFVGLRFETGGDWYNYRDIFDYASDQLSVAVNQGDPAFMLLNWIAHQLGLDFWFVTFVCGTIFVWGIARFTRNEPNPWLTILVAVPYLIIVVGMGYMRQAVAIALLMAGLSEFSDGKLAKVLFYGVLAAMFHRTAILILPIIAVSVVRHRTLVWGILAGVVVVLFNFLLSEFLTRLNENYVESGMSSEGAGVRVAMNVLPAVIFLWFSRRFSRNDQERLLWRNFSWAAIAALVGLAALSSSTVVDRLALYLIPLQLIVFGRLPYVFAKNGKANSQLIVGVILYCGLIQFVWFNFALHSENWLPYQSVLTEEW